MARIDYPQEAELSEETRALLGKLAPLNIFRMMSHGDHLLRPFLGLGTAFLMDGTLDPIVREVAILRVGYLSNASYETAQHEKIGRDVGMSDGLIEAVKVGAGAPDLSDEHREVIAYVDDLVKNVRAGDATFTPILKRYGPGMAQELTLVTGYYMMVCRFLETFGVDIEAGGAKGIEMNN